MKKKILLILACILFLAACGKKEDRPPGEVLKASLEELEKKDSFTASYTSKQITTIEGEDHPYDLFSKIEMGNKENHYSKIDTHWPSIIPNVPDSDSTLYTLVNPDNPEEIFEYYQAGDTGKWEKEKLKTIEGTYTGQSGLAIYENFWEIVKSYFDSFQLLERGVPLEDKKTDFYELTLSEDQVQEMNTQIKEGIEQITGQEAEGYPKIKNYIMRIWIDPETNLPLQAEIENDMYTDSEVSLIHGSETLTYTGFDNVEQVSLPEEVVNNLQ